VTWAIAAGHRAAAEIDATFRSKTEIPPSGPTLEEEIAVPAILDEEVFERPQERMPLLSVEDRIKGFQEVETGYFVKQAQSEACRCLRCDVQIEEDVEELAHPEKIEVS
jgi:hypothetical protein